MIWSMISSGYWIFQLILWCVFLDFRYRRTNELFNDSHQTFRGFRLFAVLFVTSISISQTQRRPRSLGIDRANCYDICVDCYRYHITLPYRGLRSIFLVHVCWYWLHIAKHVLIATTISWTKLRRITYWFRYLRGAEQAARLFCIKRSL